MRLDAPFSARSSEIDETKVARNSLKDRHSRRTTDLNSIDNPFVLLPPPEKPWTKILFSSVNQYEERIDWEEKYISRECIQRNSKFSILSRGDVVHILRVKQRMREERNCNGELGRAKGQKELKSTG